MKGISKRWDIPANAPSWRKNVFLCPCLPTRLLKFNTILKENLS